MAKFNDKEKFPIAAERSELTSTMRSKKETGDRVREPRSVLILISIRVIRQVRSRRY